MMEPIIRAVDRVLLEKELNDNTFIRDTNNGNNQIFVFSHSEAPHLMREVGRLRELSFRDAGGGTGKSMDIDAFDTAEIPFKQLIVWDPREKEIVGGYRFLLGRDVSCDECGNPQTPTSRLFKFSEMFIKEFWPTTIELGRSFVQPMYQPLVNIRRGMYSLDNLWDGLGAITVDHPDMEYFFGKITMYPEFDTYARDLILFFMHKYFPDPDELVRPVNPVLPETREKVLKSIFLGDNYDEDYKILVQKVRSLKMNIPPLVNAYMNLSGTMRTFGTSINKGFGDVEETAIIIKISDIYLQKKDRHISTYKRKGKTE